MQKEILAIRKKTGLSQAKFAEKYNIPLATYTHWEQGRNLPPNYVVTLLKDRVDFDYTWADRYITVGYIEKQISTLDAENKKYAENHKGKEDSGMATLSKFLKGLLVEWKDSH